MAGGLLNLISTGSNNIFSGSRSGYSNTTGSNNIFSGVQSGYLNTTGERNLFLGAYSGKSNSEGIRNVFIGYGSGHKSTGTGNVFIGYNSGYNELKDNKLYIDNSTTDTPLIYGDFATNQLGVNTDTIPTGYAFAVKGKIITEEVKVQIYNNWWPDYVFAKEYNLPTLKEVETHIKEKGHLADIPSAAVVAKEGFYIGDMNAKLLQKIEELTLYTIEQEKKINELEKLKFLVAKMQSDLESFKK